MERNLIEPRRMNKKDGKYFFFILHELDTDSAPPKMATKKFAKFYIFRPAEEYIGH